MQYVVVSSTAALMYSFFLPIVCRLWRRIGHEPICLLVRESGWPETVLNNIDRYLWTQPVSGYQVSTVAQVSRLAAGAHFKLADDDRLITSDADMLVFDKEYFSPTACAGFTVYGGDAYPRGRWPMCYIEAPVRVWRSAFKLTGSVQTATESLLRQGPDDWNLDETLAGKLISYEAATIKPRGWFEGRALRRIDRAKWGPCVDPIDCHALRPGWQHWDLISEVLHKHAPDVAEWADNYSKGLLCKK